tara:strand:- start:1901 stop:2077 length:177 start_codon:yes stop_codon:yes gene_type:complete
MTFPGGWEWLVILLLALLLFGGKRLPGLAKGFVKAIREVRGAVNDAKEELEKSDNSEE